MPTSSQTRARGFTTLADGIGRDAPPLLEPAGIAKGLDEACLPLAKASDAAAFLTAARALRWPCELALDLDAKA